MKQSVRAWLIFSALACSNCGSELQKPDTTHLMPMERPNPTPQSSRSEGVSPERTQSGFHSPHGRTITGLCLRLGGFSSQAGSVIKRLSKVSLLEAPISLPAACSPSPLILKPSEFVTSPMEGILAEPFKAPPRTLLTTLPAFPRRR